MGAAWEKSDVEDKKKSNIIIIFLNEKSEYDAIIIIWVALNPPLSSLFSLHQYILRTFNN